MHTIWNYRKNKYVTLILRTIVSSFLLNLVWENAQAPFYAGYAGFWQHFIPCFRGALGDVLIIALLYVICAWRFSNAYWIRSWTAMSITFLVIVGIVMAILIEYTALSVGRWAYTPMMPIFLWTKAGLWPVLQMAILPYVTFRFVRHFEEK